MRRWTLRLPADRGGRRAGLAALLTLAAVAPVAAPAQPPLSITAAESAAVPRPDAATAARDWGFIQKLLADGMHDIAARQLLAFAASYPDDARAREALLRAGELFATLSDVPTALQAYDRLIERFPDSQEAAAAALAKAELLRRKAAWSEAAAAYQALLASYPAHPEVDRARLGLAESMLALSQRPEASRLLRSLLGGLPAPDIAARAWYNLGLLHLEAGDDSLAVVSFDTAFDRFSGEPVAALALLKSAETLAADGRAGAARSRYERLLAASQEAYPRAKANLGLAQVAEQSGDVQTATRAYREVVDRATDPAHAQEALAALARLQMRAGNWDDAALAARTLLSRYPQSAHAPRARLLLAQVAAADEGSAAQDSLAVLGASQDAPVAHEAWCTLAGLREQARDLEGAIAAWQEAQRRAPRPDDRANALLEAARVHGELLGRRALAAELSLQAAAADVSPGLVAEALLRAMDHLARAGDVRRAMDAGTRLLQEHPTSSQAAEARALARLLQRRLSRDPETAAREMAELTARQDLPPAERTIEVGVLLRDRLGDPPAAIEKFRTALTEATTPSQRARAWIEIGLAWEETAVDAALRGDLQLRDQRAKARDAYAQASQVREAPREAGRASLALLRMDLQRAVLPDAPGLFDALESPLLGGVGAVEAIDLNAPEFAQLVQRMRAALTANPDGEAQAWLQWRLAELSQEAPLAERVARLRGALRAGPSPAREATLRYALGQLLLEAQDHAGAAEQLRIVIERAQNGELAIAARYAMADAHRAAKRYALAEELYAEYAGAYPDSQRGQRALLLAGDCALFAGDAAQAAQRYRTLLQRYPEGVYTDDAGYRLGTTLLRLDRAEEALAQFQALLEAPGGTRYLGRALQKIATLQQQAGQLAAAAQTWERLIGADATFAAEVSAPLELAELRLQLGEAGVAMTWLERLTPQQQESARAVALRTRTLAAGGDVVSAAQQLARLAQGYPDAGDLLPQARLDLADALAQAGQGQAAVEQYQAAGREAASPALRARVAYAQALLLSRVGRLQEALPLLREAVLQHGASEWAAEALHKIGVITAGDGLHTQAQEAFAQLWRDHPRHRLAGDAMRAQAAELRALGQFDRALEVSHQFLERFPDAAEAADALSDIAFCHHEMGQHQLAIAAYRKVLPLLDEEEQAHAHFWMADSLEQLGRLDDAVAAFLKIPYLFPRQTQLAVTAQLRAGDTYRRMGRAGAARSLYEKVVSSQGPQSQWGQEARRRLDELAATGGSGS